MFLFTFVLKLIPNFCVFYVLAHFVSFMKTKKQEKCALLYLM